MKLMWTPVLAAGCALAACGGGEEPGAAASRDAKARDAGVKFARCMREHGIDMPDPKVSADGGMVLMQRGPAAPGGEKISPSKLRAADEACRKHLDAIKPPKLSEKQDAEFREQALKHSRCMRKHGVADFPDPTFGADGGVEIRIGGPGKAGGVDPKSATFQRAQKACKQAGLGGPMGVARRRTP